MSFSAMTQTLYQDFGLFDVGPYSKSITTTSHQRKLLKKQLKYYGFHFHVLLQAECNV